MEYLLTASKEKASGNDIAVLKVEGKLDVNTAGGLEAEIRNLIQEKIFRIVINMKGLQYISSAGIGVLMGFIWKIRSNKGDIILTHLSHDIFRIFELLDIQRYFQILETDQDAINSFMESANGNDA
jgi:anti-sigma B factor antagonist